MVKPKKNDKPVSRQFESNINRDSSLLPMLIGGLVLNHYRGNRRYDVRLVSHGYRRE
ncbi:MULTISPECIES: hypothetical protein [unclassified Mesorhizobium]|uniref:hypothetical protein n=1 Tax=unclassified Mesorhizobium TaxID=325217 RepID=UPI00241705D2|nr:MULTISPECIES: hypothetical protein [unclassified Mesorhizobium]MDG4891458.1 hypothetical protein [Mesorhizobium sp. WSM4887]